MMVWLLWVVAGRQADFESASDQDTRSFMLFGWR
jgi:hypothetical protein